MCIVLRLRLLQGPARHAAWQQGWQQARQVQQSAGQALHQDAKGWGFTFTGVMTRGQSLPASSSGSSLHFCCGGSAARAASCAAAAALGSALALAAAALSSAGLSSGRAAGSVQTCRRGCLNFRLRQQGDLRLAQSLVHACTREADETALLAAGCYASKPAQQTLPAGCCDCVVQAVLVV